MKILKWLFQYGQLHTQALAVKLKANCDLTLRHLELLEAEGVVEHRVSGRARFFRLTNSPKARATTRLIEIWVQDSAKPERARKTDF